MLLLTWRDAQHRVVRFVVVTILAAVVFALLFLMTGLVEQFHREPADTARSFGAEQWAMARGITGPFTASATVPLALMGTVDAQQKAPVVVGRGSMHTSNSTHEVVVVGHLIGDLGSPRVVKGREVRKSGEVVADSSGHAKLGSKIRLGDVAFSVVGLTRNATILAGVPLVYVTLTDAQDLVFGSRAVVTGFLLNGAGANNSKALTLRTTDYIAADTLKPLENAISSIDLVRGLLWLVATIIIGAVVYLSALDRQRDFAVLKAVGASNRNLATGLGIQAVAVALIAVFISTGLQVLMRPSFPLRIRVPAAAFWQVPLLAAVVALLAAGVGMRKVIISDPAAAFAGPGR